MSRAPLAPLATMPLTARSQKVLYLAEQAAKRFGDDNIGTEHLLLGIVEEQEGIAAGVLQSLVQPGKIETAIKALIDTRNDPEFQAFEAELERAEAEGDEIRWPVKRGLSVVRKDEPA